MRAGESEQAVDILGQRPLGATGLAVTPLGVGCAPLGDMPDAFGYGVTEEQALATYRAILDGPLSFLDTAAAYGDSVTLGVHLPQSWGAKLHPCAC